MKLNRLIPNRRLLFALTVKALHPPEGGWHAETFRRHGEQMVAGYARLAKTIQRKAIPVIARKAHEIFSWQIEKVIERATRGRKAAAVSIEIGQNADVWFHAIADVFEETGVQVAIELTPMVQSVMAQGYSKTGDVLGTYLPQTGHQLVANRARQLASRITGIDATTRDKFRSVLVQGIEEGRTVSELAAFLRETMLGFSRSRISTIARTETMNAWTAGSVEAFQQSEMLTHVSVIGCESREEDRWTSPSFQKFMYRGEGTCNIQDVPVHDADKLNFHPNHTGVIVPSRFRDEDGRISEE